MESLKNIKIDKKQKQIFGGILISLAIAILAFLYSYPRVGLAFSIIFAGIMFIALFTPLEFSYSRPF